MHRTNSKLLSKFVTPKTGTSALPRINKLSAVAPLQPGNLIRDLEIAVRTCLRTPYEGSLALPYKDQVRTGPDTPLPRTAVPVELPSYWLFVHNWTDLPHTPLRRNVVARSH